MVLLKGQAQIKFYEPRKYGLKQDLHFGWTAKSPYEGIDTIETVKPIKLVDMQLAPTIYGNGMEMIAQEVDTKVSLAGVVSCIWVSTKTLVYGDEVTCPVDWSKAISTMYKATKKIPSVY